MTTFPKTIEELPATEFYAILTPESTTYTEDWGPPDKPQQITVRNWKIKTFASRSDWEAEIKRRSHLVYGTPFKAVVMKPVTVKTSFVVEVQQ